MKKLLIGLAVIGFIFMGSTFANANDMWGAGSPDWLYAETGPSPVIFQFNPSTGLIKKAFYFDEVDWMWISGLADSGRYLYASHNIYYTEKSDKTHDFGIAKIDRYTGEVLSDTRISGFLDQTYSQVNALEFANGRLYGVENATSGSTIRGYAIEIVLNGNGDVIEADLGAYVGDEPDCGLDYNADEMKWYATSWGYTDETVPKQGSLVFTSPDIMAADFTQVGDSAVEGIGMIDGWEFAGDGTLYAVSWYGVDYSATAVYSIARSDTDDWVATSLYDLASQLPEAITALDGLSEYVPVPTRKQQCKKGGWETLVREDRTYFKNQGDCIQYVNTGK